MLPYATIVAEAFAENTDFTTPVVEGGGTGAGRGTGGRPRTCSHPRTGARPRGRHLRPRAVLAVVRGRRGRGGRYGRSADGVPER